MKRNTKLILLCLLMITVVILTAGCGETETPYEVNDRENYTVSVKFDANGGFFTTNTPVITDSYNLSQTKTNGEGKSEIALIPPESEARGKNKFQAVKNGYFLAGWYESCTVQEDSNGQMTYTYADKWDFEADRLEIDPNGTYSSAQPVKTLYAAWVHLFTIEYYDADTGECLTTTQYNPMQDGELELPAWNEETGALDMKDIPAREGYTFMEMYLDSNKKNPVTTETLTHSGTLDETNATANGATMKLYVKWEKGTRFRITTAQQLVKNASLDGHYEILADLDFTNEFWPAAFMHGEFTGEIIGNDHTISNVVLEQTNTSKMTAGVFGKLAETAAISDLKFDNVVLTIKAGTRVDGTYYGLLAGVIADGAQITNLQIENSVLQIDSGCYFGTDAYGIGLVCGMGTTSVAADGITCIAVGANPEKVEIVVADDNTVTVTIAA